MWTSCNYVTIVSINMLVFLIMLLTKLPSSMAQLRPDFYANSCPHVESIVRNMVQEVMSSDPSIAGGLLRQQYHDCFVNVCSCTFALYFYYNLFESR